MKNCAFTGCVNAASGRSLCWSHVAQLRRGYSLAPIGVMGKSRLTAEERFWAKVDKNGPVIRDELGPCWIWTGAATRDGYGAFEIDEKQRASHHWAWLFSGHEINESLPCVLHACDNRPCVRPEHLFGGTMADNAQDMIAKGRAWFQRRRAAGGSK